MTAPEIKAEILRLTREYSALVHQANLPASDAQASFSVNHTTVPYAGRVFNQDEVEAAVGATLDFWLTLGSEGAAFERELSEFLGVKFSILTNSGSSANLLAISALTSHKLPPHKRLRPGDEIITCAAGFPTTVAPILQCGAVPVFIDNDPLTGNADCSQLEAAWVDGKTKAVIFAHTLGNPFDLATVLSFCRRHDLWLIEDNCDSLGSTYTMPVDLARSLGLEYLIKIAESGTHPIIKLSLGAQPTANRSQLPSEATDTDRVCQQPTVNFKNAFNGTLNTEHRTPSEATTAFSLTAPTGSFGDLSTQSFYPPHHITLGEGGAINIPNRAQFKTILESFRDWGRDCWCASGVDNTCNKRFGWQLGELPEGYDHKYIYSHLGYNLKPLDIQAAIGRQQLKKLPQFIEARKRNWEILRHGLADLDTYFHFTEPTHSKKLKLELEPELELDPKPEPEPKLEQELEPELELELKLELKLELEPELEPELELPLPTACSVSPSWFGFMLLVKASAPFTSRELAKYLDLHKVGCRMLFGGNLVRQPVFVQLRKDRPDAFRIISNTESSSSKTSVLPGADQIMEQALFIGTYPGLTTSMLDYVIATIHQFVIDRVSTVGVPASAGHQSE